MFGRNSAGGGSGAGSKFGKGIDKEIVKLTRELIQKVRV